MNVVGETSQSDRPNPVTFRTGAIPEIPEGARHAVQVVLAALKGL
jgi:hypothetical protein